MRVVWYWLFGNCGRGAGVLLGDKHLNRAGCYCYLAGYVSASCTQSLERRSRDRSITHTISMAMGSANYTGLRFVPVILLDTAIVSVTGDPKCTNSALCGRIYVVGNGSLVCGIFIYTGELLMMMQSQLSLADARERVAKLREVINDYRYHYHVYLMSQRWVRRRRIV